MARSVQWRRVVSDACNWHQTEALEATIYLLRQTGPTGFLLKEEGERKTVKVLFGDPHTCTCPVFKKERDLCKHICWLLLRKFKLSQNDPLSWQLGLVERELNEVLQGRNTAPQQSQNRQSSQQKTDKVEDGRVVVQQREIAEDDVCPICQDELMSKKLPVTYCRFGCGNTIHIKCMSVWAEHQQKTSSDKSIKCPMCREDFGSLDALKTESRNAGVQKSEPPGVRMDRHLGIACSHCSKAPIEGKCYKCTACPHFFLCQRCFNLPVHTDHAFQFRQKRNQRWRAAARMIGASLPPALVQDLMNRDISEQDYDSLLLLDSNAGDAGLSTLTEEALHQLPIQRVRERSALLQPGAQCRVCLRGFDVGQYIRKLPCYHKFHKDCIDNWLLHSHSTCPIDGLVALTEEDTSLPQRHNPHSNNVQSQSSEPVGEITSNGLSINAMGIPFAPNRLNQQVEGQHSILRRPPRIPLNNMASLGQHHFEVSGTSIGAGDDESYRSNSDVAEPVVPPERDFRIGTLHRQRLVANIHGRTSRERSSDRNYQAVTLGDIVRSVQSPSDVAPVDDPSSAILGLSNIGRNHSAGSVISVASDNNEALHSRRNGRSRARTNASQGLLRDRGQGLLRDRGASSLERAIPSIQAATRTLRDLYLGNDPIQQPPVNGAVDEALKHLNRRKIKPSRLARRESAPNNRLSATNGVDINYLSRHLRDIQLNGSGIHNSDD